MTRFSQLIDEVADQKNHSLSDVLLKAKVLAYRLPSRKFRQWVKSEIDGYDEKTSLPTYRVVGARQDGERGEKRARRRCKGRRHRCGIPRTRVRRQPTKPSLCCA